MFGKTTLGQDARAFMAALDARLDGEPSPKAYKIALSDTLRQRRFAKNAIGLRSLAEAAFRDVGAAGIKAYLSEQSAVPLTRADAAQARRKLGPALKAALRSGHRELDAAQTADAFALKHGLELVAGTVRGTYQAPVVLDATAWSDDVRAGLRAAGIGDTAQTEALAHLVTEGLDGWQRVRDRPTFGAILASFTRAATLGRRTHQFLAAVRSELSESPTKEDFEAAVETTLGRRRYRDYAPGLRALAAAAWADKGTDDIACYLREQSEIAFDADVRDGWNRDVRGELGPILATAVRNGKKEITTADTVQAFALEHGLQLLGATIQDRYRAPEITDVEQWRTEVRAKLSADLKKLDPSEPTLDLTKIDALTSNLAATFETWTALPEGEQKTLFAKMQALAKDLEAQPREVLLDGLKDAAWKLGKVPTEAHLLTITATSMAILAKVGISVASLPMASAAVAIALIGLAVMGGQFAADLQGGIFHHRHDNYPGGRTSKAFIDHHYDPRAVSTWPMIRNTHGTSRGLSPVILASAALLPGGGWAGLASAFLVSFVNGLLYTQHVHGRAHASEDELSRLERFLQSIPFCPVMLPREEHQKHHSKPLGKEVYGVLNGWSNALADKTGFYRMIEDVREYLTGEQPGWKDELRLRQEAMSRKKHGRRPINSC